MGKYKSYMVIEDNKGNEVCREGDKVTLIDTRGTYVTGIIETIDYCDGDRVILFEGWNTKVVIEYIDNIINHKEEIV